jgi:hypothetical protein
VDSFIETLLVFIQTKAFYIILVWITRNADGCQEKKHNLLGVKIRLKRNPRTPVIDTRIMRFILISEPSVSVLQDFST